MITISLGTGSITTSLYGYNKLIAFYGACKEYRRKEILISFENLTWFDANMSALLQAIISKLASENDLKFFANPIALETKFDILIRNGFLGNFSTTRSRTGSEIALTGFDPNDSEKFVEFVENKLLVHPNLNISDTDRNGLIDAFFEVFGNVQKHARTPLPVYACGQYYPQRRELNFTLVDLGVGYLMPIQEFTDGQVSVAAEAIRWALRGNSSLRGFPGGLGLQNIQRFCKENNSTFGIITGDAGWNNRIQYMGRAEPFCGTVVNLIFNCN